MEKVTRKNSPPVKVYCLPDERVQLEQPAYLARSAGGQNRELDGARGNTLALREPRHENPGLSHRC
ncbi:MAG: hypothetical protein JWP34_1249 [Massilia sp.]|nr:hypothetical protein [Massilia sp.]